MTHLMDKIPNCYQPLIFYEIIPPSSKTTANNLDAYAQCAVELLDSTSVPIDGINIPEIRDEHRDTERTTTYEIKSDARDFGRKLKQSFHNHHSLEVVINHCTVFEDWNTQKHWLDETIDQFDIHNLILVGGESSKVIYPGPSVTEMTKYVKDHYQDVYCGGIVIPTRKNEAKRMFDKGLNGTEYFTSQVLYEPYNINHVLQEYAQLCQENNVLPKRVFLSFAPISSRKDCDFLRWLGVQLPSSVMNILLESDIGIGWRSMKVSKAVLNNILNFMRESTVKIPLGLNIEHVSRHNFELSKEFIEQLGAAYYHSFETKYNIFD